MHDHRDIGRRLDLFHSREDSPGQIFWHPRGYAVWRALEDMLRSRMGRLGYREVRTPVLLARGLWERSGHWDMYGGSMFKVDSGDRHMALKPMSCPCHLSIFSQVRRSYRDLPFRLNEFGHCHRDEASGALSGVMRTKSFVQDDAHVLCRMSDVPSEVARFVVLLRGVYEELGFPEVDVALSLRPAVRAGDDALWDEAEGALRAAALEAGLEPREQPGEGAFYGPKLEFSLRDALGRSWQCGTAQLDVVLPGRLGAEYVDADDERRVPVMIHHAVLGSMERFIGILLEHHGGELPFALSPDQVAVLPVSQVHAGYASEVASVLADAGIRVVRLDGADTLSRRIVEARAGCVPVLAVVGGREVEGRSVDLTMRGGGRSVVDLAGVADAVRRCR